jgi:Ca2+-transporting ATPase
MSQVLDPAAFKSLTPAEAAARLSAEGPNALPQAARKSLFAIAVGVLREPMLLLLLAGGGIYFLLGNAEDAALLMGFVVLVIAITLLQERRTERAIEALRDLSSPRAHVIRDGHPQRIPGRDVVRGDLLVLAEGDRVPADGVLLAGLSLAADESLLTGESVPVNKRPGDESAAMARPGGDDSPFVYSGTLITSGQGFVRVKATGAATEMGRIGAALSSIAPEKTRLEREVARLVRGMATAGIALCVAVVLLYGFARHTWLTGLLAGITLAMALLPEEFPVILTVFMALGAFRIAKQRVLTRKLPAIEALGAATVLCTDKTGTLTQNRMTVQRLWTSGEAVTVSEGRALPEAVHALVEYAILASQRDPFDPMEKAIRSLGERALAGTEHLHADWQIEREYPLSPELLSMSHVFRSPDQRSWLVAAKGAPEAIVELCHLPPAEAQAMLGAARAMAAEGLRVLGVARALYAGDLPPQQHDFDFVPLGLLALADPVREAVPGAIAECRAAGIRVIVITGDSPETARAIGRSIGLPEGEVVTGPELEGMSDEELAKRAGQVTIFARAVPEHKLRIVQALRARGEVVAMTGDGVNDAPALKAADIGVAMGGRGTDVAREAAALVLTDDDFASIVGAVRMGRRIWGNLEKAMAYVLAVHVPIAGMSLLPVLFGWPPMLMPVHVAVLEMIIDPACSIAFEAEPAEEGAMQRPPRRPETPLLSARRMGSSLLLGACVLLVTLAVFSGRIQAGRPIEQARMLAFVALVVGSLGQILVGRSFTRTAWSMRGSRNTALWLVVGGASAFLALSLLVPPLRGLFGFAWVEPLEIAKAAGLGLASVLWFDLVKVLRVSRARPPQ